MGTKFKTVKSQSPNQLHTWLNSLARENYHFLKMEPFVQTAMSRHITHGNSMALVAASRREAETSLYYSAFIGGRPNGVHDSERIDDLTSSLGKCGFGVLDYMCVASLQLEEGHMVATSMKGYLFLWGMTLPAALAEKIFWRGEWIRKNRLEAGKGANDPGGDEKQRRLRFIEDMVRWDKEALKEQMGPDWDTGMQAICPDIQAIDSFPAPSLWDDSVDSILWLIEGNLAHKAISED